MSNASTDDALMRAAGKLSHELNNIFMVVQGNLTLMAEVSPSPDEKGEMVLECLRAVGRGIDLSSKLQAYAGQRALRPTLFDLRIALYALSDKLQSYPAIEELKLTLPPYPCQVRLDRAVFEETILELAQNANDALSSAGTLFIDVDVQLSSPPQTEPTPIRLTIADDGSGMDEETMRRAIEPMFSLGKDAGPRRGWGLSTVAGFVRQSGGHLVLSNAKAGGLRVDIYFPGQTSP